MSFIIDPYRFNTCPAEALAFIAAAGITDTTQKQAICKLVSDLQGYGIWNKMKAIYPFCGSTSSQMKYNLKDPRDLDAAYRLVFSGGWTFSNTGALPNGVNAYADTKFTSSLSSTLNSTHVSFYSRTTNILNVGRDFAAYVAGGNPVISLGTNTGIWLSDHYNFNDRISTSITNALGFFIGTRTSSTSHKLYKNGTSVASSNVLNTNSLPNISLFIGAANTFGGFNPVEAYSNKECAFASIGDGLTDTESANFYTAVQAYQTTLGRQV